MYWFKYYSKNRNELIKAKAISIKMMKLKFKGLKPGGGGLVGVSGCASSSSSSTSRPGSVSWHQSQPREQIPDFPPVQPPHDDSDEEEGDDDFDDDDDDDQSPTTGNKRRKL